MLDEPNPQVGEIWINREGSLCGPLEETPLHLEFAKTHPLCDQQLLTYTLSGRYLSKELENDRDLVRRVYAPLVWVAKDDVIWPPNSTVVKRWRSRETGEFCYAISTAWDSQSSTNMDRADCEYLLIDFKYLLKEKHDA